MKAHHPGNAKCREETPQPLHPDHARKSLRRSVHRPKWKPLGKRSNLPRKGHHRPTGKLDGPRHSIDWTPTLAHLPLDRPREDERTRDFLAQAEESCGLRPDATPRS